MASLRECILAQLYTSVNAIPSLGATVYRGRQSPQMRIDNAVVVIEPGSDEANEVTYDHVYWTLSVHVQVIARGTPPDQAADSIVTLVYAKILSDPTVGGLAMDVQPVSTVWTLLSADKDTALVENVFHIKYRASLADLSLA